MVKYGDMPPTGDDGREPAPRFIIAPDDVQDEVVYLRGDEGHHARNVLRLRRGDALVAIDGTGTEYEATVQVHTADGLMARVTRKKRLTNEPLTRLTLAHALTRNAKLSIVVGQTVALGVREIVLVSCARSTSEGFGEPELNHLNAVAAAAAKQSLRAVIPRVVGPVPFKDAAQKNSRQDYGFICHPDGTADPLLSVLARRSDRGLNVLVIAGPEGGFTTQEVGEARAAGMTSLDLGPRRLRTGLAATAACSLILFGAGDLGPTRRATGA